MGCIPQFFPVYRKPLDGSCLEGSLTFRRCLLVVLHYLISYQKPQDFKSW